MKFGKQLELGIYKPWHDYYIQYNKLKRLIKRLRFIKDRDAHRDALKSSGISSSLGGSSLLQMVQLGSHASLTERDGTSMEETPLLRALSYVSFSSTGDKDRSQEEDFNVVIMAEVENINKFYNGKLAELRSDYISIIASRENNLKKHHAGAQIESVNKLRAIYLDVSRLKSYCELNDLGFYKIVKKYDKVMEENTLG